MNSAFIYNAIINNAFICNAIINNATATMYNANKGKALRKESQLWQRFCAN